MRAFAILLLVAAAGGAPVDGALAARTSTSLANPSGSGAADRQASALLDAIDFERLSTERGYARETRERLEALRDRVGSPQVQFGIDIVRQMALLIEGRSKESLAVAQRLLAQQPALAYLYTSGLWAAMYAHAPEAAVDLLEGAARHVKDAADLEELRTQLTADLAWSLIQELDEKKDTPRRRRAAEAFLILGGDDRQAAPWLEGMRAIAIDGRVAAGRIEDARTLAGTLIEPRQVIRLAGSRRYDGLFASSAERERALTTAIAASDRFTADWLTRMPENAKAILARAQHLRSVGKEEEALALLLPHTEEMAKGGDETGFWIVNEAAYALAALGRHAEAVALMEKLLTLSLEDHPALISMAINHGEILIGAGRYQQAVAWDEALEAKAKGFANEYGFMWLWSTAACAESLAGNPGRAAPWLSKLAASSDHNPAAHTRALLCANDLPAAETLVLKRLEGDKAEDLLAAFHDYRIGTIRSEARRILDERVRLLLDSPKVKLAMAAKGHRLTVPLSKTYWGDF